MACSGSPEKRFFREKWPFRSRKRGRIALQNGLFRHLKVAESQCDLGSFGKTGGFFSGKKWQTRAPETDFPNKIGGFSESLSWFQGSRLAQKRPENALDGKLKMSKKSQGFCPGGGSKILRFRGEFFQVLGWGTAAGALALGCLVPAACRGVSVSRRFRAFCGTVKYFWAVFLLF